MATDKRYVIHKNRLSTLYTVVLVSALLIIAAIIIPSTYKLYMTRSQYGKIVAYVAPYKTAIEQCYQQTNTLAECNAGEHNVPYPIEPTDSSALIRSLSVKNGEIKITPRNKAGITARDQLVLTPNIADDSIRWEASGKAVELGLAN